MKKISAAISLLFFAALAFAQTSPIDFFHQYSKRQLAGGSSFSAGPYRYNYVGRGAGYDSVTIYAVRVEFRPDSVINTTGNGLFMRADTVLHARATDSVSAALNMGKIPLSRTDRKEFEWYRNVYKYDRIPHNEAYFNDHLTSLRNYFLDVSNGKIKIGHKIFPSGAFGAIRLDREMAFYSPGNKRRDETFDDFYTRSARALMRFVSEAIDKANTGEKMFSDLKMDGQGRILDANGIPVFILLIHAGSSGLTDGSAFEDSPSDLTASFVGEDLFRFFNSPREDIFGGLVAKDERTGVTGAKVSGANGQTLFLSEVMMVSETANQDSLNWGINGILVNQFARQIGIPDLYSTSSGTTGIGRFGIMDFAGYYSAQGFIPPNPSAFVRSFMGWDEPKVVMPNGESHRLTVGKDNLVLVPINNTEYYLIENRQRNLTGDPSLFVYDTIDGRPYISQGFEVNLESSVDLLTLSQRGVVMNAKSRDIGIPASGACVWHINEKLVDNRIKHNMLNSDSSFRAVTLVEADGVVDLGVEFRDMRGFPWYDYGSAADVFPHTNSFSAVPVREMSPTTMPSTAASDGGNSYLKLSFSNSDTQNLPREIYRYARTADGNFENYTVTNFSDSTIILRVTRDDAFLTFAPNFPVRIKGNGFYPLLTADVFRDADVGVKEIVALSKDGFLSVVSEGGDLIYEDKVQAVNMPSFVGNHLFVPSISGLLIYDATFGKMEKTEITAVRASSFVTGLDDKLWAVGTRDGNLIFGRQKNIENTIKICDAAINALAKFNEKTVLAVCESGNVFLVFSDGRETLKFTLPNAKNAFAPFKIAVSDNDIVIADNKQGLWFLKHENGIKTNAEQDNFPVDWAGIFREETGRFGIPDNGGFLSMALLSSNADGGLTTLVGGTNGVYAFDQKGYLLENYPALLDRADWAIRKSVTATPVTANTKDGRTLLFFTTATGDARSYYQTKIDSADLDRRIVWFSDVYGNSDSISGLPRGYIDTLLTINDSIILPYFAPGGLIDVRDAKTGKRPDLQVSTQTGQKRMFPYLMSVGEPLSQGVVLDDLSGDGQNLDLIAVSDNATLYRVRFAKTEFLPDQSDMTGGNAARQFNFASAGASSAGAGEGLQYFYSYPNPVRVARGQNGSVTFRYELGDGANSAHLAIYTVAGVKVFEERNLKISKGVNEYVINDLSRFGSAVYRCRLSIKFGDGEKVLFWKMALLR